MHASICHSSLNFSARNICVPQTIYYPCTLEWCTCVRCGTKRARFYEFHRLKCYSSLQYTSLLIFRMYIYESDIKIVSSWNTNGGVPVWMALFLVYQERCCFGMLRVRTSGNRLEWIRDTYFSKHPSPIAVRGARVVCPAGFAHVGAALIDDYAMRVTFSASFSDKFKKHFKAKMR